MICRTAAMFAMHYLSPDWRPTLDYSVDSTIVPARCHYDDDDGLELCNVALASVADAWAAQVDTLGFEAPMPDDDGLLDLYMTNDGTDGGAYTYGPYEDEDDKDGKMGCHAYMVLSPAIGASQMPYFVAHEFQHVLQYATDFTEPTLPIWEAVAEAAMAWTYTDQTLAIYELKDFQKTPWLGILGDSYTLYDDYGVYSYYEYGAGLWILHLEANWGDGTGSSGVEIWQDVIQEGWANEPDVLDAYEAVTGDWRAALLDFSVQRARVGTETAPDWASFAGTSGKVKIDTTVDASELPADVAPRVGPYQTGVIYVEVEGLEAGQTIKAEVQSDDDLTWAMLAVEGASDSSGAGTSIQWTSGGETVTIGVLNLGKADFDADQRIRESDMTLRISVVGEGDTGGDDTGGGDDSDSGDDTAVDSGDDTGAPHEDPGKEPRNCGCASGGSSGAAGGGAAFSLAALGLMLARRRR